MLPDPSKEVLENFGAGAGLAALEAQKDLVLYLIENKVIQIPEAAAILTVTKNRMEDMQVRFSSGADKYVPEPLMHSARYHLDMWLMQLAALESLPPDQDR
jgi:hypothetical protein